MSKIPLAFVPNDCADEIIKVLEKHEITVDRMEKVFELAKQKVYQQTPIHIEEFMSENQ